MIAHVAGIERHSAVNGPGVRYVVFFQGCTHHCPGCQNPETWALDQGAVCDTEEIKEDIRSTKYLDGVTLSGGDPLLQAKACKEIIDFCSQEGINVWCYTGWTFGQILEDETLKEAREAIENLDVLVDGPFVLSLLTKDCLFRGSSNQRLIDVKRSLQEGKICLLEDGMNYGL